MEYNNLWHDLGVIMNISSLQHRSIMPVKMELQPKSHVLTSTNPSTGQVLWQGEIADAGMVDAAVKRARAAFAAWSLTSLEERIALLQRYAAILTERKDCLSDAIIRETGKVRREARAEVGAVIGKITISIEAYHARTGFTRASMDGGITRELSHRAIGVMAVFGPYNFPMHLPNGHMVPALLAGNTVVFKPSEETPMCGELLVSLLQQAGFPDGVVNIVQGGRDTGVVLSQHTDVSGILFTGSYATGKKIHAALAGRPEVMLALEMGGNNPLIVLQTEDVAATARLIVDSAFSQAGQRCTCTRRVIIPHGAHGDAVVEAVAALIDDLHIDDPFGMPEPYYGALINNAQADNVLRAQAMLVSLGGRVIREAKRLSDTHPFMTAGLVDITDAVGVPDEEVFGPLLSVIRVAGKEEAIAVANATSYGLSAGLLSDNVGDWEAIAPRLKAGVLNYNRPTNGAVSAAPFGGPGRSGNYRPSAYYAADYCAYPVSTLLSERASYPPLVGLKSEMQDR
jgi:succinylglutamic semialdehyde dehydrogenase